MMDTLIAQQGIDQAILGGRHKEKYPEERDEMIQGDRDTSFNPANGR
jgi:hypothetical protein